MKTLIAVPCMDHVHAGFTSSLFGMRKIGDVRLDMACGSLIYNSRNKLIHRAIDEDYDRILWFDSDMVFQPDVMERLCEDIDAGMEIVSGLYFTRKQPIKPTIFKECATIDQGDGKLAPVATTYDDYPKDDVFEIMACGFGCVMMDMKAVRKITDKFGMMPFMPVAGWGEDLSFCLRAHHAGVKIHCDSRIKLGHIGTACFDERMYELCQP